jgi:hypothetical protein
VEAADTAGVAVGAAVAVSVGVGEGVGVGVAVGLGVGVLVGVSVAVGVAVGVPRGGRPVSSAPAPTAATSAIISTSADRKNMRSSANIEDEWFTRVSLNVSQVADIIITDG